MFFEDGRLDVRGLRILPRNPSGPEVYFSRFTCGLPTLSGLVERRLEFGTVAIDGMVITAHQQRTPPPLGAATGREWTLSGRRVELRHGRIHLDRDRPLPDLTFVGIDASARRVQWTPDRRRWEGGARAAAKGAKTGAISVTDLAVRARAEGSEVWLEDGSAVFAGSSVAVDGHVTELDARPALFVHATVDGVSLRNLVEIASGDGSPLDGRVRGTLELRSGGDLPRGGAYWEAELTLTEGAVRIGRKALGRIPAGALQLAWGIDRMDHHLVLEPMRACLRFGRGWAEIADLRYEKPEGRIELWGDVRGAMWNLYVHPLAGALHDYAVAMTDDGPGRPHGRLVLHKKVPREPRWICDGAP